eukprot:scaffold130848_cov18-Prasinocladus_malaysianus.AAC.3
MARTDRIMANVNCMPTYVQWLVLYLYCFFSFKAITFGPDRQSYTAPKVRPEQSMLFERQSRCIRSTALRLYLGSL